MLNTDERRLLVELLAPPGPTFRLNRALATTFTLDLTALLPIPLALAGRDLADGADPLAVMQAIRYYADRIDVFCQAGQIGVERKFHSLLAFLEPLIHAIPQQHAGELFHPKIWVLRFASDDGDEPDRMRVLCGSRNLTHDRAWDAVVTLDGVITKQPRAVNRPLADFIRSLPGLARHVNDRRRSAIGELADDVRRVEWEPVAGSSVDGLRFHALGPGGRPPSCEADRLLIVSPFLNDNGLNRVLEATGSPDRVTIVSRAEAFDALNDENKKWIRDDPPARCYVLDEAAAIPSLDTDESGSRWELTGLHAKVYVAERGASVRVFIGSANATDAGFGRNYEFLVEIGGRRKNFGIDGMIGDMDDGGERNGFGSVLLEYEPAAVYTPDPEDDLRRKLVETLRVLAANDYEAQATVDENGDWVETARCAKRLALPADLKAILRVSLATIPNAGTEWTSGVVLDAQIRVGDVADLTPFVVLELSVGSVVERTAVLATLVGAPDDRLDRVLARQFAEPGAFVRFVLLLLRLAGDPSGLPFADELQGLGDASQWAVGRTSLLEALVTALARSPSAIDDIGRLVERLERTDEGRRALPPGWADVWDAVRAARESMTVENS